MMLLFDDLAEITGIGQQFECTYYVGVLKPAQQRYNRLIVRNDVRIHGVFFSLCLAASQAVSISFRLAC